MLSAVALYAVHGAVGDEERSFVLRFAWNVIKKVQDSEAVSLKSGDRFSPEEKKAGSNQGAQKITGTLALTSPRWRP